MSASRTWGSASIAAFLIALPWLAMSIAVPVAAAASDPALFHGTTSSTNWAGYAVTGAKGSFTEVSGSWIEPTIQGKCPSKAQFSSFWVGIDGFNSNSVEQTGTDSDCHKGSPSYYAWYEFYPNPSHRISTVTVHAGDTISADVKYASGTFTLVLTDVTTGKSFSTSAAISSASRSSAEWIAEAPSSFSGVLPLANFGTAQFGFDYTNVSNTSSAVQSGTAHLLGNFSSATSITMIGSHNALLTKATTSAISSDNTSFTCVWKAAGP